MTGTARSEGRVDSSFGVTATARDEARLPSPRAAHEGAPDQQVLAPVTTYPPSLRRSISTTDDPLE
jgi:hypothetical protein